MIQPLYSNIYLNSEKYSCKRLMFFLNLNSEHLDYTFGEFCFFLKKTREGGNIMIKYTVDTIVETHKRRYDVQI